MILPQQASKQNFCFSTKDRLLKASEFSAVFSCTDKNACKKVFSPAFVVLARYNQESRPRLGLAIAKKHLKLAVDRNRVKRFLRESFRLNRTKLENLDIVVISRKNINNYSAQELHKNLNKIWYRLNK